MRPMSMSHVTRGVINCFLWDWRTTEKESAIGLPTKKQWALASSAVSSEL